jgi:hypothetical protein
LPNGAEGTWSQGTCEERPMTMFITLCLKITYLHAKLLDYDTRRNSAKI